MRGPISLSLNYNAGSVNNTGSWSGQRSFRQNQRRKDKQSEFKQLESWTMDQYYEDSLLELEE